MSGFLADLEKGRRGAALLLSKMPHVIPHSERVVLFRKHIADEKAVMGLTESACNSPPTTLIVVHRSFLTDFYGIKIFSKIRRSPKKFFYLVEFLLKIIYI